MKLMGVDVGFSKVGNTTGIAYLDDMQVYLTRAGTSWESRRACVPSSFCPSLIALDGPLVPDGENERIRRRCEWLFIHAPFHNRCKPGLSDWGKGLELRQAAANAFVQFSKIIATSGSLSKKGSVQRNGRVVEAFPNAFLAVLLPEQEMLNMPNLRRGQKFDWLYEKALATGKLEVAIRDLSDLSDVLMPCLRRETDHELRAALICLLTAAFAAAGASAVVGDASGGWFWLPPLYLWQGWAKSGLRRAATAMANKGHPVDLPIG
jgi:hypothetical protein